MAYITLGLNGVFSCSSPNDVLVILSLYQRIISRIDNLNYKYL